MLDDAFDDAQSSAQTLRTILRTRERTAGQLVSAGSLSSVSKNNASQSYAYGNGATTAIEIARGWRELIDCFDATAAALASTDDTAIAAEMRLRLVPVREFTKDFASLHCA